MPETLRRGLLSLFISLPPVKIWDTGLATRSFQAVYGAQWESTKLDCRLEPQNCVIFSTSALFPVSSNKAPTIWWIDSESHDLQNWVPCHFAILSTGIPRPVGESRTAHLSKPRTTWRTWSYSNQLDHIWAIRKCHVFQGCRAKPSALLRTKR